MHDSEGNFHGVCGISTDITEHKKAESLLRNYADELRSEVKRQTKELEDKNSKLEVQTNLLDQELNITRRLYQAAWERVYGDFLGNSPAIQNVRQQIESYAETMLPVLLCGPVGAGEEAIARAIHMESPQRDRPFIQFNSMRQSVDSGHKPDIQGSAGKSAIDLAEGGTLFIDELLQLDNDSQQELLNLLANPVPKTRIIAFLPDVYFVTNKIEEKLDSRLLEKIQQHQLNVPALVERQSDIPLLIEHFVEEYSHRAGKFIEQVTTESIIRAKNYDWPRNIRQLRQVVEQVVTTSTNSIIDITEDVLYGGEQMGRYQLLEKIGEGGMGEVWLAQHQLLARPVALKLIRTDLELSIQDRQLAYKRFEREARMMAKLQAPNTIRLFDYGVTEHSEFYFVMELLRGMNVHSLVNKYGPMPAERTAMLLKQVCRSLMEAHAVGIVHRDIKPHNLFVCMMGSEYDYLKVLDFGIVKPRDDIDAFAAEEEKNLLGSVTTTSPEMLRDSNKATFSSDIYSLGCTAFWMLTGQYLFKGESVTATAWQHLHTPPKAPSEVVAFPIPPEIDQLVLACLAKDPKKRPSSVEDVLQQLDAFTSNNTWNQDNARDWWQENAPDIINREEYTLPSTSLHVANVEPTKTRFATKDKTFLKFNKPPESDFTNSAWKRVYDDDNPLATKNS